MAKKLHALSLKQPWATLLVHGLKTIEIRRWPTTLRGRILIHAARIPDSRPEAWARLPEELWEEAKVAGGIIGQTDLIGCKAYPSLEAFAADQELHLNDPAWFEPPLVYGFTFANAVQLPFRPYSGWFRFFTVKWDEG
jgi:hypothetical protein